jgi:hypothetical protein
MPSAPVLLRWFHLFGVVAWLLLAVPTVMWWRNSLPWVGFMLVYQIVVEHWSGYQAARIEARNG